MNGMKQDMKEKRARYIGRNNELLQEFGFAHPKTKFQVNLAFNSHFSGQVLWDLFSREAEMIENTWNLSFKLMYDLPRSTHRYLVEPVSDSIHIKKVFVKRFLNKSSKIAAKNVFTTIKYDCRSLTGYNLRNIRPSVEMTNIAYLCHLLRGNP